MPKRIRTSLFLDQSQLTRLSAMSAKTGAPVAEIIRRAIDTYIKSCIKAQAKLRRN